MKICHGALVAAAILAAVAGPAALAQTAGNQPARPTGVKNVEVMRFVVGKQRRHHRVHDRFADAIRNCEQKHGDIKRPIDAILAKRFEDRIGRQLKLHDLHVLMAVVQAGSMRKGAALLNTTQPAVSRSIA